LLPAGELRLRLSVAVPPASAEADERARDVVCPSDTDATRLTLALAELPLYVAVTVAL
jgi:hypothetical protein